MAAWRLKCGRIAAGFDDLARGRVSELNVGLCFVDLFGESESLGMVNFPLVFSRSKTREDLEAREEGDDFSVALGEPGIGVSCTLCRFEFDGYLGRDEYSPPVGFFAMDLAPFAFCVWPCCKRDKCLFCCNSSISNHKWYDSS
jgi:hypothetical protein